ncbi:ndufs4 NADH dehydrogenase Fe-S protein subunit [Malassezia arunalokei]|uniref:NADH dehydrogenase [ubiquinone] iron-sulfur protein 4, mitochondrial n=1 Tax=Malassezia arunalokei TaxID=1514897 RepID=A0AAJ5Z375_9BASI|nr:ndufs4 NADH dehydrogenase Fe-S protein subunit [Malassezia arunalokei]
MSTMMRSMLYRHALPMRPSLYRTMHTSLRVGKDSAHQTVPARPAPGERRDLVAEQVNRISEPTAASVVSDAPNSLHQRYVRIFQPAKPATQSGRAGTRDWRVEFEVLQGSGRWESPLMGWASTADHQQSLSMRFDSLDAAVHFCEKQGWNYLVQQPHKARIPPKSYAANFKYSPGKLRIHHTK